MSTAVSFRPLLAAALAASFSAGAAGTDQSPVVVTATREERPSFDLPVSIDVIDAERIQFAQPQVNASESLIRIPGITANNRYNYAQDPQIQTRGFGARSQFGVRGIRIYQDGIPLSTPDGQGQTSTFNLSSAKSIEVMRGPFSALYGNSSGGVVQIFTRDAPDQPTVSSSVWFGSFNTHRENLQFGMRSGNVGFTAEAAHFESDGYRQNSSVRRETFNTKLAWQLATRTRLIWTVSGLDQPETLDPQGLTLSEYRNNRKAASPDALTYRTRVQRSQYQTGLVLDHQLENGDSLRALTYYGTRENLQFLAGNAFNLLPGASEIQREFAGVDLRYTHRNRIAGMPMRVTAGFAYEQALDKRRSLATDANRNLAGGLANLTGGGTARARNEENNSRSSDFYAQGELDVTDRLGLHLGARYSQVRIQFVDKIPASINPVGSGTNTYQRVNPVAGIVFKITPALNWYANAGGGFETPTSIELAYTAQNTTTVDGSGPNLGLRPATSKNYETGLKAFLDDDTRATLAVFQVDTRDEIVVAGSQGGRTAYANGGRTSRQGLEFSLDSRINRYLNAYAAYTYINAEYRDSFGDATVNEAGKKLPGISRDVLYGELAFNWPALGFQGAVEGRYASRVYANDANTGKAPGYTVVNLRAGFTQRVGGWTTTEFVRIDNLFDREFVGAVRVNDSSQRFYEAAPGRFGMVGVTASYAF
jgi:iron complex outermembrane receptor protein